MQASNVEKTDLQEDPPIATFKMIVIGSSGVGKSTFIKQLSREVLEERVVNDQKITIYRARFITNFGAIEFNMWDLDAPSVETETPEEFFMGADCAILMFDTTSRVSYKDTPFWYKKIIEFNDVIPITMVGNKVDIKDRKVRLRQITFHRKRNLRYHDISARANYNIEQPFVSFIKVLTKENEMTLIENPVVQPPEIVMDDDLLKSLEAERIQFEAPVLPDDDDF